MRKWQLFHNLELHDFEQFLLDPSKLGCAENHFGQRYANLPLILNGVMDPRTTAHGPNESLHLGVFRKAIAANVYLLAELAALPREA